MCVCVCVPVHRLQVLILCELSACLDRSRMCAVHRAQVLTLCEEHGWEELDLFASERRSPIGWEPFLQLAKRNAAPREVQSR